MASRSAAPPASKVFVGGLAWETRSEALRRHFEHFGDILEAVVISDKTTGRSKGYGFVTFRDPESARRACADPSPVIEGRRANCNLASMGRPRPAPHYAHIGPAGPYFGGLPIPQVAHIGVGSSTYNPAVLYNYQQAIAYPPYGYTAYEPEYVYPQNVFNPYTGQQYVQLYNVPGTLNPAIYPYGQFGQSVPSGHGYTAIPGYTVSGHIYCDSLAQLLMGHQQHLCMLFSHHFLQGYRHRFQFQLSHSSFFPLIYHKAVVQTKQQVERTIRTDILSWYL